MNDFSDVELEDLDFIDLDELSQEELRALLSRVRDIYDEVTADEPEEVILPVGFMDGNVGGLDTQDLYDEWQDTLETLDDLMDDIQDRLE